MYKALERITNALKSDYKYIKDDGNYYLVNEDESNIQQIRETTFEAIRGDIELVKRDGSVKYYVRKG